MNQHTPVKDLYMPGKPQPSKLRDEFLAANYDEAPHSCDVPDCPGALNKRKLEAFEELVAQLAYLVAYNGAKGLSNNADYNHLVVELQEALAKAKL